MTDVNEIKKWLYRNKPEAKIVYVKKNEILFNCEYSDSLEGLFFAVPLDDIQDAIFYNSMPAQQLIRWLITPLS